MIRRKEYSAGKGDDEMRKAKEKAEGRRSMRRLILCAMFICAVLTCAAKGVMRGKTGRTG